MKIVGFKLRRHLKMVAVAALLVGVANFVKAPEAFAATKTWTGAGADRKWSTADNWSPSGAPANGDDIVISDDDEGIGEIENDIANLTVGSIHWSPGAYIFIDTTANSLHISGDVSTGSVAGSTSFAVGIYGDIVLGDDVTWSGISLGKDSSSEVYSLDLNGNSITFENPGSMMMALAQPIIGTGTVIFNHSGGTIDVAAPNTYAGDTVIIGSSEGGLIVDSLTPSQIFGSSSIRVSSGANLSIILPGSGSYVWTNEIIIEASAGGLGSDIDTWSALLFVCSGDCSSSVQIDVPNIVMEGNVRLMGDDNISIDLDGIEDNGYCVEVVGFDNIENAPPLCTIDGPDIIDGPVIPAAKTKKNVPSSSVKDIPKAPNGGIGGSESSVLPMALMATGVSSLGFIVRKSLLAAIASRF